MFSSNFINNFNLYNIFLSNFIYDQKKLCIELFGCSHVGLCCSLGLIYSAKMHLVNYCYYNILPNALFLFISHCKKMEQQSPFLTWPYFFHEKVRFCVCVCLLFLVCELCRMFQPFSLYNLF